MAHNRLFMMMALGGLLAAPCMQIRALAQQSSGVTSGTADEPASISPKVQQLIDSAKRLRKATPPLLADAERNGIAALSTARRLQDFKGEAKSLLELALIAGMNGQHDRSVALYLQAAAVSHKDRDREGEGDAYFAMAVELRTAKPETAISTLQQAITLFREVGSDQKELRSLTAIGGIQEKSGREDAAGRTYREVIELARTLGDEKGEADGWWYLATLIYAKTGFATADLPAIARSKEYYVKALTLYRSAKDGADEAWTDVLLGDASFQEGSLDEASKYYEEAVRVYRSVNDHEGSASSLLQLSNYRYLAGRYLEALQLDYEALGLYNQLGDASGKARSLLNIAAIYRFIGRPAIGMRCYQEALPLLEQSGDQYKLIDVLQGLAGYYHELGDRKSEAAYLNRLIPLLQRPATGPEKYRNLNVLGDCWFQLGDLAKARATWEQLLAEEESGGFTIGIPGTLNNLGALARRSGDNAAALKYYQRQLPMIVGLQSNLPKALVLHEIGSIEEAQGQHAAAEQSFGEAVKMLEAVRGSLGGLSEAKSVFLAKLIAIYQDYLALLVRQGKKTEAFNLAQKMKARSLLDILDSGKVRFTSLLTQDEREEEESLRQRSDTLNFQLVREGVQNEIGSKKRAETIKSQLEEAERKRREFEDRIYVSHPELAVKRAARTITLEDVGKFLPPDTALLEYVTLSSGASDQTILFVVTVKSGQPTLSSFVLPITNAELASRISALRTACSDPAKPYKSPSQSLYDALLLPAESQLVDKKRLLICPDGFLWDVPFAALISPDSKAKSAGSDSAFLIDRFEVDYAYSATGAGAQLAHEGVHAHPAAQSMLVFADPSFGDATRFGDDPQIPGQRPIEAPSRPIVAPSRPIVAPSRQSKDPDRPIEAPSRPIEAPSRPIVAPSRPITAPSRPIEAPSRPIEAPSRDVFVPRGGSLAQLPGTLAEAQAIKASFPDATILTGTAAQETTAKQEAGKYRYLHFATHGFFNDAAPFLSSIVLAAPDKSSRDDGFLTARELFDLDLNAEMVVLSACNTARGEKRDGEGIIGLTWALFAAGVPTQVVSQWSVNDESTAQLMTAFYQNLTQKKLPKGEALREAALSIIKSRGSAAAANPKSKLQNSKTNWSHPYYWAPFILMGDWR